MALHHQDLLDLVASAVASMRRHMMVVLLFAPTAVLANGNCTEKGALFFLGNTADGAQSVWLSATNSVGPVGASGYYRLDAAQANQNIDSWDKIGRGLHLSLSPVVSNGNGGTHKLLGNGQKPCLLDSQNQKGGIIPPGGFHRPSKPPTGITPTVPTNPEPLPIVVPDPAALAADSHEAKGTPCAGGRIDRTDPYQRGVQCCAACRRCERRALHARALPG